MHLTIFQIFATAKVRKAFCNCTSILYIIGKDFSWGIESNRCKNLCRLSLSVWQTVTADSFQTVYSISAVGTETKHTHVYNNNKEQCKRIKLNYQEIIQKYSQTMPRSLERLAHFISLIPWKLLPLVSKKTCNLNQMNYFLNWLTCKVLWKKLTSAFRNIKLKVNLHQMAVTFSASWTM